jgi:HEAT repeat protein
MKKTLFPLFAAMLAVVMCGFLAGCGGEKKPKVDLTAQLARLKSQDANERMYACIEIAKAKEDAASAVPALVEALKDRDSEVRRLAAYALGEIGEPAAKAIPALKQCLRDEVRDVITQAMNSIRAIDPKALDPKAVIPNVMTGGQ